jgi:hypothetical protein
MPQPTGYLRSDRRLRERYRVTHSGVVERLADPYLTEHDRWVLLQFARFLSGQAPEPDPRVAPRQPVPPVFTRVRRSAA